MKTYYKLFSVFALMLACLLTPALLSANTGKATFNNNAQRAGKINAKITYSDGTFCNVVGSVEHPIGTTPADKATTLAADINAQCVHSTGAAAGGTVTITSDATKTITEIDINDRTNQSITVNPSNLDDDKKRLSVAVTGLGIQDVVATIQVEILSLVLTSASPILFKPAEQVVQELAQDLNAQLEGLQIDDARAFVTPFGTEGALLEFFCKSDSASMTIDMGGDGGLEWDLGVGVIVPLPPVPFFDPGSEPFIPWPWPSPPASIFPVGELLPFGPPPFDVLGINPPQILDSTQVYLYGRDYALIPIGASEFGPGIQGLFLERPGIYGIRLMGPDGIPFNTLIEYDMRTCETCCPATNVTTEYPCGAPDVAVTASDLNLKDKWGNPYDPDWSSAGEVHEAGSVQGAKQAICTAYENNGNQPVSVVIDAHGSPGSFTIGGEKVTIKNLKNFVEGIKGKVSSLSLMSCETALGEAGMKFICQLEQLLGADVTASTGTNSDVPPSQQDDTGNHWYTDGERVSWEPDGTLALDLGCTIPMIYNPDLGYMTGSLVDQGLLPPSEPFSAEGTIYHYPFNPIIDPELFGFQGPDELLDWAIISIHDPNNPSIPIASQPVLFQGDGHLIQPDGAPLITFHPDLILQDSIFPFFPPQLQVSIRQPRTLDQIGEPFIVDSFFDIAYQIEFEMPTGDGNGDGVINAADRSGSWNQRNAVGYLPWDLNFDGVVNAADRSGTWNNRNLVSNYPY